MATDEWGEERSREEEELRLCESEIKDLKRREKALQNDLAVARSQLAVKDEKLKFLAIEIGAAKASSRESSFVHVAQLSTMRDELAAMAKRSRECERQIAEEASVARESILRVLTEARIEHSDALFAANCAFEAIECEARGAHCDLEKARNAEAAAARALDGAREEKNRLIAKSNSLHRTLESLKQDLGRMTREAEKQRLSTQQLRLTLSEAIDDRDKAIASKEEWREAASFPTTIEKIDKASAKENE